MALSVATGLLAITTLTSSATHTSAALGFTPKAGLFLIVGRTGTTDANGAASHTLGYGFAVDNGGGGVTMRCVASQSFNGNTTMGADVANRDDCVVAKLNNALAGGTLQGTASVAWGANDFTLTNVTAFTSGVTVMYKVWGGSDLVNYEVGTITEPGATGVQSNSVASGITYDVGFFLSAGLATINTVGVDSYTSLGVASGSGAGVQWTVSGGSDDALGTSNTEGYYKTGEVLGLRAATPPATPGATSMNGRATFNGFGSGTLSLNWTERAASRLVFYMALKGGQWAAGKLGALTLTNGGTNTVSGLAFQPLGLLTGYAGFSAESTADTPAAADERGFGVADSISSERSLWLYDMDAAATGAVGTGLGASAVVKFIDSGGATNLNCQLSSFNSDGFTLTNNVALGAGSGTFVAYLCCASNAGGGGGGSAWGAQLNHTWCRLVQTF